MGARARALVTRQHILRQLAINPGRRVIAHGVNPWANEDPDLGDMPDFQRTVREGLTEPLAEAPDPEVVGRRIQTVGQWSQNPSQRNLNFEPESVAHRYGQ